MADSQGSNPSPQRQAGAFEDLSGKTFGRLLVIEFGGRIRRNGKPKIMWRCLCSCGNKRMVWGTNLRIGKTKSCGCLQKEKAVIQAIAIGKKNKTHGMWESPEWLAWKNMKDRCHNENHENYPNYGGRGIRVCERWINSFSFFLEDMGKRPSSKHSLDRKDCNGDYEPSNCRWSTVKNQSRNRRSTRLISYGGQTKCLAEWAEDAGLTTHVLYMRLLYGWPFDLAISTPVGIMPKNLSSRRLPVAREVRLKAGARSSVKNAVAEGVIIKATSCEYPGCSSVDVTAHHHHGYEPEFWLDVIWLCRKHHDEADHA